jgi:6-phosphogluconate dehydrogenase (decarboxylating)
MVIDAVACAVSRAHDEGAALLRGKREFGLDAAAIAGLLRAGRGGSGWLADHAVAEETQPATSSGYSVVNEAVALRTPAPVLSLAAMLELGAPLAERASGPAGTSLSMQRAGVAADHKDKST